MTESPEKGPTVQSENSTMSPEIGKLAEALARAQGAMKGAVADADNPFFKSSYADLSSVWEACREPLSKNGLAVIQTMASSAKGTVRVITTLAHSSGQWIRSDLTMYLPKIDPQSTGSGITYARRYALSAMVGIAPIDDDGEAAMGRGEVTASHTINNVTQVQPKKAVTAKAAKPQANGAF